MIAPFVASSLVLLSVLASSAFAQSQSVDAQIEGVVIDSNGSAVVDAAVTAINIGTGTRRSVRSRETGTFRFPLLSLGSYSVVAEHPGFKRSERRDIMLSAGETATIEVVLEPGSPSETVSVSSDAAIADQSKFEVGRQINGRDVKSLPLVSRNPTNFILLQPGTSGRSVTNPVVVNLSSNGLARRVGYEIDGSYNNEADISGFRLLLLSEIFVKEVQLLSGGYSAEFGNTAGTVVNVVTPSGTNDLNGSIGPVYRPHWLAARPFGNRFPTFDPRLRGLGVRATLAGPLKKDRWHFYTGFELDKRSTPQLVETLQADRESLIAAGVPASVFNGQLADDSLPYFIFRTDLEASNNSRLAFRFIRIIGGGLRNALSFTSSSINTTERSFDFEEFAQSIAGQYITNFSNSLFNEFRFQRSERITGPVANENSSNEVTVSIAGVANLGRAPNIGGRGTNQSTMHFQNASTLVLTGHTIKFGGGINLIRDAEFLPPSAQYSFSSVTDYVRALGGIDRRSYSQFVQTFGDPISPMNGVFVNLFIQDEWALSRRARVSAGLRYDLFVPPEASPNAPLEFSRSFNTDANDLGPRLGFSYLVRDGKYRTVVRVASGVHYDPPQFRFYRGALQNNGDPRFVSVRFLPGSPGSPNFPDVLSTLPPDSLGRTDIDAVSPDLETMYAVHTSSQVEQALGEDLSMTLGYLHSFARHIPLYRSVNCKATGATLADGRPVYGTPADPCSNRLYPQFGLITMLESSGNLTYDGVFLQVNKRFSNRFQFGTSYTFSKAADDAPEEFGNTGLAIADPSDRSRDRGTSANDVRHVFRFSMVANPRFPVPNRVAATLLNGYQLGMIVMADSGEAQNIVTNIDLNRDGLFGSGGPDRPVGIPRNSLRIPSYFNIDLSFGREFPVGESRAISFRADVSNLLNGQFVSAYNAILPNSLVDASTGRLRGPLPDFSSGRITWRPSRQVLLSAKFAF